MTFDLFNQILNKDIAKEFNWQKYSAPDKIAISAKITDRLQKVILETALANMSDDQFIAFSQIMEKEKDAKKIQEKISALAKEMPNLNIALQENLNKEIEALKQII